MNHKDLESFRNRFLTMLIDFQRHEELESQLSTSHSGDEMDQLKAHQDNVLVLNLKGREQNYLLKIHQSLDKIEDGVFGICEECGNEISLGRLNAWPTAELCIHCKEEEERAETHILYERRANGKKSQEIINQNVVKLTFGEEEKINPKSNVIPFL